MIVLEKFKPIINFILKFRQTAINVLTIFHWSLVILSISAIFIIPTLGYGESMIESYNQWYVVITSTIPIFLALIAFKICMDRLEGRKLTLKKVMYLIGSLLLTYNVIFQLGTAKSLTGNFMVAVYVILITLLLYLIIWLCDLILHAWEFLEATRG